MMNFLNTSSFGMIGHDAFRLALPPASPVAVALPAVAQLPTTNFEHNELPSLVEFVERTGVVGLPLRELQTYLAADPAAQLEMSSPTIDGFRSVRDVLTEIVDYGVEALRGAARVYRSQIESILESKERSSRKEAAVIVDWLEKGTLNLRSRWRLLEDNAYPLAERKKLAWQDPPYAPDTVIPGFPEAINPMKLKSRSQDGDAHPEWAPVHKALKGFREAWSGFYQIVRFYRRDGVFKKFEGFLVEGSTWLDSLPHSSVDIDAVRRLQPELGPSLHGSDACVRTLLAYRSLKSGQNIRDFFSEVAERLLSKTEGYVFCLLKVLLVVVEQWKDFGPYVRDLAVFEKRTKPTSSKGGSASQQRHYAPQEMKSLMRKNGFNGSDFGHFISLSPYVWQWREALGLSEVPQEFREQESKT